MSAKLCPPCQSRGATGGTEKKTKQKQNGRKASLIKNAYELIAICDAEVCPSIIIKETGQVVTFCSDSGGFGRHLHHIWYINYECPNHNCETNSKKDSYYPVPPSNNIRRLYGHKNVARMLLKRDRAFQVLRQLKKTS